MPLPKTLGFLDLPEQLMPSEGATVGAIGRDLEFVNIAVTHEIGSDLTGGMIASTRWLPPSKRPIFVRVESQVVMHAVQRVHSPEYLAVVRRRKCRALASAITELTPHADREDFAVCTYPVLNRVHELLTTLREASAEGNTREILRQFRNTLMNGGWNKYRDAAVRRVAAEILNSLAEADDVLPRRVNESFERLCAAGVDPVGTRLFAAGEDDETPDGKDEVPG